MIAAGRTEDPTTATKSAEALVKRWKAMAWKAPAETGTKTTVEDTIKADPAEEKRAFDALLKKPIVVKYSPYFLNIFLRPGGCCDHSNRRPLSMGTSAFLFIETFPE